jgi:DNA-binding protein H-NS
MNPSKEDLEEIQRAIDEAKKKHERERAEAERSHQKDMDVLLRRKRAALKNEKPRIIAQMKVQITTYGITADELGLVNVKKRGPAVQKYRDPQTGETWSGRGRVPRWVLDAESAGRKREEFVIDGATPGAVG